MSSSNTERTDKEMFLASVTDTLQQPLHTFLSLVPVQSASYPLPPVLGAVAANTKKDTTPDMVLSPAVPTLSRDEVLTGEMVDHAIKFRRSSSVSSDGVGPRRFLKLGPVFWGGTPGVGDYADEE